MEEQLDDVENGNIIIIIWKNRILYAKHEYVNASPIMLMMMSMMMMLVVAAAIALMLSLNYT